MDQIIVTINGVSYTISGNDIWLDTSLNDYLRNYLNLQGTKAMCHQGGCGACVVSVSAIHPVTKETHVFAVNSCLVHILSCHQWNITTIEGLGNRTNGYHVLQRRLAAFNGTQCGFCTPGWIMNMYSLQESSHSKLTMMDVENSFAGNMCRCTGYRPILDAFKSFAVDTEVRLKKKLQDIEDLDKSILCAKKCERRCSGADENWCVINDDHLEKPKHLQLNGASGHWYKARSVEDVFKVISNRTISYRMIAGDTGKGVYPPSPAQTEDQLLIDISSIPSLKEVMTDVNLILGAGVSLNEMMAVFKTYSRRSENFKYLQQFYDHLDLVAHVPVRNIATIGGNLALKNEHREFPSDIFLLLLTAGATVTIVDSKMTEYQLRMMEFLNENLKDKLITNVKLPPFSRKVLIRTYKVMPRAQNSHAIVNAGFLFKIEDNENIDNTNIVFGGISPNFMKASETENIIKGKKLFSEDVLNNALRKLKEELVPTNNPPEPSPECRKSIALGLFYKAVLSLCPTVNARYRSGGSLLQRDISQGTQTFDTDKNLWPLNQPIPKLEALSQCAGEAKYSCDVPSVPREVHVAFVLSQICRGEIERFDASDALKLPGVKGFFTAKDIPGKNNSRPLTDFEEEILASKEISYYGQPVALVAASSHKIALKATGLVRVYYKTSNIKPVLSIDDALNSPDKEKRILKDITIEAKERGTDISSTFNGSFTMGSQYHYTMETQCCTVSNTELGVSVRSSTQWLDIVNIAVAQCLGISENRVEVVVQRVGGGYGGKTSCSALPACACAVVARALGTTATLVMPLNDNMAAIGKRCAFKANYEGAVNGDGLIQYLNISYYMDCGFKHVDVSASYISTTITNLYESSKWNITGYNVLTDKPSNTWCRAPYTAEGTAIIEHIMERIAHASKKDPAEVRLLNLDSKHSTVIDMIGTFRNEAQYNERRTEIETFNKENAWKKRGLKIAIMSYPIEYIGNFPVTVSVYHADGTIAISHGGVEMGQGINTKVAQVCAYTLKVPLEKVVVKGTDNIISPNSMATNSSITSESIAFATIKACQALLERMKPARDELKDPTWEQVVKKSYENGVNLQANYMTSPNDNLVGYNVYGACACEIELDVLTGNHIVRRVDIIEDTGVSLSPSIDVGQIEGAFIMGLGLWTSEQLVYDDATGRLLTNSTWNYKPPGAKDIPVDFRISFRRNSPNPAGVLRSKATGEPALVLAVAVSFALHEAIMEARKEFGYNDVEWLQLGSPCTVENIMKAISPKLDYYKLY